MATLVGSDDQSTLDSTLNADDAVMDLFFGLATGTVTSISAYLDNIWSGNVRLFMTDFSGNILASGEVTSWSGPGWVQTSINQAVTVSTNYYLGVHFSNYEKIYSDGSGSQSWFGENSAYASGLPDPISTSWLMTAGGVMAIRAEGTVGGGTIPILSHHFRHNLD